MLHVEALSGGYGKTQVLHEVTLHVQAGEIVSLVGRNGMGKTTLLRTVMGLLRSTGGTITFKGRPITGAAPEAVSRAGIGYVPEGRGIFPTLSVYENLIMAARKGEWSLERVYGLFPVLRTRRNAGGAELSGGEQQMLSIGRALLLNPALLILDEATEGLAPLIQDEIWECTRAIRRTGLSMIIVDKDLATLQSLADRHYVLQKGEIRWSGTTEALHAAGNNLDHYIAL